MNQFFRVLFSGLACISAVVFAPTTSFAVDPVKPKHVDAPTDPITHQPQRYLVDEGWYLPGFGYLPPWPHTLPKTKSSERFMGYLGANGLYSPYLDAIDAGTALWVYPARWPVRGANAFNAGPTTGITKATDDHPATTTEIAGRDAISLRSEGARLLKGNRPTRALSVLVAATEKDADDVSAWYLRAVAERELGQQAQAITSARRAQALEMVGQGDSRSVAKTLENVQGESRRFLSDATNSLTLVEAREIVSKTSEPVTGIASRTK